MCILGMDSFLIKNTKNEKTILYIFFFATAIIIQFGCSKKECIDTNQKSNERGLNDSFTLKMSWGDSTYILKGYTGTIDYRLKIIDNVTNSYNIYSFTSSYEGEIEYVAINNDRVRLIMSEFSDSMPRLFFYNFSLVADTLSLKVKVGTEMVTQCQIYGDNGYATTFMNDVFQSNTDAIYAISSKDVAHVIGIVGYVLQDVMETLTSRDDMRALACYSEAWTFWKDCTATLGQPQINHEIRHLNCSFNCSHEI